MFSDTIMKPYTYVCTVIRLLNCFSLHLSELTKVQPQPSEPQPSEPQHSDPQSSEPQPSSSGYVKPTSGMYEFKF